MRHKYIDDGMEQLGPLAFGKRDSGRWTLERDSTVVDRRTYDNDYAIYDILTYS
jgi:hypothetical protein